MGRCLRFVSDFYQAVGESLWDRLVSRRSSINLDSFIWWGYVCPHSSAVLATAVYNCVELLDLDLDLDLSHFGHIIRNAIPNFSILISTSAISAT
jgi:hypothetical protein